MVNKVRDHIFASSLNTFDNSYVLTLDDRLFNNVLVVAWHDLIISELLICHYYIYIQFYNFIACLYRHSNWMFPSYCVFLYF